MFKTVTAIELKKIAKNFKNNSAYEYIGIRVQDNFNNYVGENINHNSLVWIDGNETEEELSGICAIDINKIESYNSNSGEYFGEQVVIIGSDHVECGEDESEIIMENAEVIEIINF